MLTRDEYERLRAVYSELHGRETRCDQTCHWCAENWFTWLRGRLDQMSESQRPKKAWVDKFGKAHPERPGCKEPFAEAARTSVRPTES